MIQRTISHFFSADRAATEIVAFTGDGTLAVAQFRRDVAWNALRLKASPCKRGLLVCKNTYWAAVGMLALWHAGTDVAMPSGARGESLAAFLETDDRIVTDQPDEPEAFLLESAPSEPAPGSLPALDPDRCHIDLFTSGSTAAPKRISKSLRQLECEAQTIERYLGASLPPASPVHATVPHHHLYGLTFGLIWPLLSGRPFNRKVHEIWETIFASNLAGAILVTSPAHLTRLAGFTSIDRDQRPALILSAGAALPAPAAADAIAILRQAPTEIFGSTETGAIASRNWHESDAPWSPLPGIEVTQAADGRMSIVSPFIAGAQPYLGADLIDLLLDGRFRALGRADDICKIEGKRISLSAVETELLLLPEIAEAAVLLIDDGQPRLAAVVKLSPEGEAGLAARGSFRFGQSLRQRLSSRLETASLPKRWRFVAELPTRALGKRRNADLQVLFADTVENAPSDEPDIRATRQVTINGDPARLELDLYINPTLPQLDGHFPGLPIVPGVALVDWAARFAATYLHLGDGVARSLQVKFRRLITSDTLVTLVLEHQPASGRLVFTYRQGDQIFATGKFSVGTS